MATKKRPELEIYERYWKFTAAHTNIYGPKFNKNLRVIIDFINKNKEELMENAVINNNFRKSNLYKELQNRILEINNFKGKDRKASVRKVINQYVKLGFIMPMLLGYSPLADKFIRETKKEKKKILFSKILYDNASLSSDVTVDNHEINHIQFFLKTLDKSGPLSENDIIALMTTDIEGYNKGYLTREELDLQYKYAEIIKFEMRKYNQKNHLIRYLKEFVDIHYNKNDNSFYFADDLASSQEDKDKTLGKRDGVKHRIYKNELKDESISIYGKIVCYLDKIEYKSLIASHIKPFIDCLKENKLEEAYDKDNGLLLDPTLDSYFDKKDISFDEEGNILFGKKVSNDVRSRYSQFKLDEGIYNTKRKEYMKYHRQLFNTHERGN